MSYDHTQRGPIHLILLGLAAVLLVSAWLVHVPEGRTILAIVAAVLAFFAFCFRSLRVRDAGDHLQLSYGPLPLFKKRLDYGRMRAVAPARSDVLDGGGIHFVPGRGWVFNLWGFDCVRIQLEGGVVRVGSDDVPGLVAFLERRIGQAG